MGMPPPAAPAADASKTADAGAVKADAKADGILTGVVVDPAADKTASDKAAADKIEADKVSTDPAKVAADKVAADKVAADAAALAKANAVPDKYEFTKPDEGAMHADDEADTAADAKALGLTVAQAQKLYDHRAAQIKEQIAAAKDQNDRTQKAWKQELMADADFGKAKFEASVLAANKAIAQFDTPDKAMAKLLAVEGMQNNPVIAKFLARVGAAMTEGKFISGNTEPAKSKPGERSFEETAKGLFPSLSKKKNA
jgi:hypothetical protein